MRRKGSILGVLGASSLVSALLLFGALTGPASGNVKSVGSAKAPRVTVITVTAGKPSELGFKLSKFSNLPAGTITFRIKNGGLGTHNFKICTSPSATAAKNACVGKATPLLKAGQSAILTVKLTKTGKYEFLCAVPGHAAAGMKGILGVGVAVSSTSAGASTSGSGSTSTSGVGLLDLDGRR